VNRTGLYIEEQRKVDSKRKEISIKAYYVVKFSLAVTFTLTCLVVSVPIIMKRFWTTSTDLVRVASNTGNHPDQPAKFSTGPTNPPEPAGAIVAGSAQIGEEAKSEMPI
jgi:hypothetical protein